MRALAVALIACLALASCEGPAETSGRRRASLSFSVRFEPFPLILPTGRTSDVIVALDGAPPAGGLSFRVTSLDPSVAQPLYTGIAFGPTERRVTLPVHAGLVGGHGSGRTIFVFETTGAGAAERFELPVHVSGFRR